MKIVWGKIVLITAITYFLIHLKAQLELFSYHNKSFAKSIFIPIGRGNKSLDCFRIYEAVVSGSIPVIVGNNQEIERTFHFNGIKPEFLYSDSWENAVLKCEEILKDKEKQQKIIDLNFEWWVKINIFIISKINNILK